MIYFFRSKYSEICLCFCFQTYNLHRLLGRYSSAICSN